MGVKERGYYDGDQWKGGRGNDQGSGRMGFGGGLGFKGSVISVIVMINVAVFVLDMFSPSVTLTKTTVSKNFDEQVTTIPTDSQQIGFWLSLKYRNTEVGYPGPTENPLYVYQLLTHGFTHASVREKFGIMHIALNMMVLVFLGLAVERKLGRSEFLKFYILAILFSGIVWLLTQMIASQPARVVGASGAVTAVVMLFILNYPRQTLYIWGVLPMPAWLLGILLIGMDIMNSFRPDSGIAVAAHLGGAAFAAIYFFGKLDFTRLKFNWLTERLSGKPRLKVHNPTNRDLTTEADRILAKVHSEGEQSLTRRERKTLENYSKNVRKNRDDD